MSKACDKSLIIANFDSRLVIYDKIGTANLIYMVVGKDFMTVSGNVGN